MRQEGQFSMNTGKLAVKSLMYCMRIKEPLQYIHKEEVELGEDNELN